MGNSGVWTIGSSNHRAINDQIKDSNHTSPSSLLNELLTAAINLAFKLTLLSGLQKSVTHFIYTAFK